MDKAELKRLAKRTWRFIWHEDSFASWVVNVILAFILIKFLVYPGLGFMLGTQYPVVAVISSSMEHDGGFDDWWQEHGAWYEQRNISKEEFQDFRFTRGFNKGDIMVLTGPDDVEVGDVIVYQTMQRREPIIHRVVDVEMMRGVETYTTKGDNNQGSFGFERDIISQQVYGEAVVRVPLLGWVKILFLDLLSLLNIT